MATSIFFDGRVISIPGAYSKIDASGLETIGLSATGIVAVLGTAVGGKPVTAMTEPEDFLVFSSQSRMQAAFREGQLREVSGMLFNPSNDADIRGGAQQVVAMKVNPATQSSAFLQASAANVIELTSVDYGAFTSQINVDVQEGTNQGILLTITFEDDIITKDDLGGDALFHLMYSGGTNGYSTALASLNDAGDLSVVATRAATGLAGDQSTSSDNAAVEIVSSNAGDTTQTVVLYGVVGGVPTKESLDLDGTNVVTGATVWDADGLRGVIVDSAHAGTITVRKLSAGATIFSLLTGTLTKGVLVCDYHFVANASVTFALDAAGAHSVVIWGRNTAGSQVAEAINSNGATPVVTVRTDWSQLDVISLSEVPGARTFTLTATAMSLDSDVYSTLQKVKDFCDSKKFVIAGPATRGFVFTYGTGETDFLMSDIDIQTNLNIKDPVDGDFTADLYTIVEWINENSEHITAEVVAGATAVPDATPTPVFLSGGVEGTPVFANYQTALDLLKKVRVNSIVDLSGDAAVAAALDAHCSYMGGAGRNERDGFVGLLNSAEDDVPSKTEAKAAIIDINSRHIRATAQAITRFNSSGERERFLPPFAGAVAAAMQAGSSVGTSLTSKYANVLAFDQDSSWNPVDDAEELIQAGLLFLENKPGVGRRWVRNVTTFLTSDNLAFTEGSVNHAVNIAVYEFRTGMETAVGKPGFHGTVSAAKGVAQGKLGKLVDEGTLTQYRALTLELIADVLDVSVEMSPVVPINFVTCTIHLSTLSLAA